MNTATNRTVARFGVLDNGGLEMTDGPDFTIDNGLPELRKDGAFTYYMDVVGKDEEEIHQICSIRS